MSETEDIIEAHAEIVMDNQQATRDEWLAQRRTGLGGSDAAAALALSPYKGRATLYAEKVGDYLDERDSQPMFWGRQLESAILDGFSELEQVPVRRYPYMLRSKEHPFMTVNLDGITTDDNGVAEVKNVNLRMADEWRDDSGEPKTPDHYGLQGQHALAVTGLQRIHFACLIGGQELRHIVVERDDELIEMLIEHLRAFWTLVETRTPPAMDGLPSTAKALADQYDKPVLEPKEVDRKVLDWLAQRAQVSIELAEVKERHDALTNSIKAELGNHQIGTINGEPVVTWKSHDVPRVKPALLRERYPEIAKEVTETKPERKIHVPKSKALEKYLITTHQPQELPA